MLISKAKAASERVRRQRTQTVQSPVGVEIGNRWMRIAQQSICGEDRSWSLSSLNQQAEVLDDSQDAKRNLLQAARQAAIPGGRAVVTLASPLVDVLPIKLQPVEGESLDAQVVTRARDQLSYPLEEAVLDYSVLPDRVHRAGEEGSAVLVFAAPRQLVESLIDRLAHIGLQAERALTPACALAQRLAPTADDTRQLVIATAEESVSLGIVQAGDVLLERILSWGSLSLKERLQEELDLTERQCSSLLAQATPTPALQEILAPPFGELAREAAGCLGYCDSYLKPVATTAISLTGPLAGYPPLQDFLGKELELPVHQPGEGLDLPGLEDTQKSALFATAACSALWALRESA